MSTRTGMLQVRRSDIALGAFVLAVLLAGTPGPVGAQFVNQVTEVSPMSAPPNSTGLLVTFTLETDFPPPPPPGDGPQSVQIGTLTGTSITHATQSSVTAVFDIPAGELAGTKDVTLAFEVPGGTLVFSKAGGFTVTGQEEYDIERTLADAAQRNTIAFDGLAFLTGCLGAQSFLPPGKVADYSGFQYLRDNDPTQLGHNTDFVTIVAFNVLHILSPDQVSQLVDGAQNQIGEINQFAYDRFPLLDAFRRQFDGDLPPGSAGLDSAAVVAYTAGLYRLDGVISYHRARIMGGVITSLSPAQRASLDSLGTLGGVGNWDDTLPDPLQGMHLDPDVNVAVMTYASEMYAWYAGSVEADTYFCPERHGTWFGSFYLKDWPAMGNPGYTIDEQLTARAGEEFLSILPLESAALVTGLVDLQRDALYEMVDRRTDISTLLRGFMAGQPADSSAVSELSARYGELDGQMGYWYATRFTEAWHGLDAAERSEVAALADSLGYLVPPGAFLYSAPIPMPDIIDTDFLFGVPTSGVGDPDEGEGGPAMAAAASFLRVAPNPSGGEVVVSFRLPTACRAHLAVFDATGRLTAVLAQGDMAAGNHEIRWSGSRGGDRPLARGTYFLRLEGEGVSRCVKFALAP